MGLPLFTDNVTPFMDLFIIYFHVLVHVFTIIWCIFFKQNSLVGITFTTLVFTYVTTTTEELGPDQVHHSIT